MSAEIDRLFGWLADAGGRTDGFAIRGSDGARGAWSNRPIRAGEHLVDVPGTHVLTEARAAVAGPARLVEALWPGHARPQLVLASFLLAPDPEWTPWIDALPASLEGHPLLWTDTSELRGTLFADLLAARRRVLLQEHAWIRGAIPALSQLTPEAWLRARSLVSSRTFAIDADGNEAFVPVADLFDHATDGPIEWIASSGTFSLRARRDLPADTPLFIDYGRKQNVRFFLYYGFVLPDNPVEGVVIDLGVNGRFPLVRDEDSLEMREMLAAIDPDRDAAVQALAVTCRARLEDLPPPAAAARPAVRVIREEERRILQWWAERG